jgi:uncharacterized membrane protein YphA (DoxX/SURF4 family)
MLLKGLTTGFLALGLIMLGAWPFAIAHPGPNASARDLAVYGAYGLGYFGLVCVAFLGAALCAVILVRRQIQDYKDERQRNLSALIKGSLEDHDKRP